MDKRERKTPSDLPPVDSNAWMVTFGDLTVLLLTFFVMLLSMKSMDTGKMKEIFDSFLPSSGPLEYTDIDSYVAAIKNGDDYEKSLMISSSEMLHNAIALLEGVERLPSAPGILEERVEVSEDERGVVVVLEADDLFESGSTKIKSERLADLDAIAGALKFFANDILIMGHTDDLPIRGKAYASNLTLSFYRAMRVYDHLTDIAGLDPERLAVGGYGCLRPRHPNDSEINRAKNRRIEFILKKTR
jgi:chemotaxis protein MotB